MRRRRGNRRSARRFASYTNSNSEWLRLRREIVEEGAEPLKFACRIKELTRDELLTKGRRLIRAAYEARLEVLGELMKLPRERVLAAMDRCKE